MNKKFEKLTKYFGDETTHLIEEDFQLYMLQAVNDENQNILHHICKLGSDNLIKVVIEVATKLSALLKTRKISEQKELKPYIFETPQNPNVFVGMMHVMDLVEYTPFFYLCERGNKCCKVCNK